MRRREVSLVLTLQELGEDDLQVEERDRRGEIGPLDRAVERQQRHESHCADADENDDVVQVGNHPHPGDVQTQRRKDARGGVEQVRAHQFVPQGPCHHHIEGKRSSHQDRPHRGSNRQHGHGLQDQEYGEGSGKGCQRGGKVRRFPEQHTWCQENHRWRQPHDTEGGADRHAPLDGQPKADGHDQHEE
jgi:hypothetical protein